MDAGSLSKLLALLASLGVAVLLLWLLTRHDRRQQQPRALLAGYPLGEFPHRDRIEAPLASLCESQASVLALFRQLPPTHSARAHLFVFLGELRTFMDDAYVLAALRTSAEAQSRLVRLAREVRRAADQLIESTQEHARNNDGLSAGLEWRVEVMKALARDPGET